MNDTSRQILSIKTLFKQFTRFPRDFFERFPRFPRDFKKNCDRSADDISNHRT